MSLKGAAVEKATNPGRRLFYFSIGFASVFVSLPLSSAPDKTPHATQASDL